MPGSAGRDGQHVSIGALLLRAIAARLPSWPMLEALLLT
jgi:hypothetical protein